MNNSTTVKKVIHFKFPKRVLNFDAPFIQAAIDRCRYREDCINVFKAFLMFEKNEDKPFRTLEHDTHLSTWALNHCINELVSNGLLEMSQR